ncbi:hypothetical protein PMAYCL1PPCAC_02590, partial [Pristionchus mayeri]
EMTLTMNRRAFVTPPGQTRVQAAMTALKLSIQKKHSYQVVTCKKMPYDIFLASSFGFTAENVTVVKGIKKFVVAEINVNTAAEKHFSVGDVLIDFRGLPIHNDGATLKQFNVTFQTVGEIDVLVERPVSAKSREATAGLIKNHLSKHDTPPMCDEVTKIGLSAARYHKMFWRRMTPVPIFVKPGAIPSIPDITTEKNTKPEKPETKESPKKKGLSKEARTKGSSAEKPNLDQGKRTKSKAKDSKKSKNQKKTARGKKSQKRKKNTSSESKTKDRSEETKEGLSIEATTMDRDTTVGDDPANNRVKIVGAKSFQEITSDVDPATELESIGLRYADDFEDENTQDDEEQKKLKRARAALRPIKKGLFSTMALFKKQDKEKKE